MDAGCENLAYFLEEPLINLSKQQKLNIIIETFEQKNLMSKPQYKEYFGNDVFQNFLAWYVQQQSLQNNPNAATLAGMFGKPQPSELEQNRCNSLLSLQITVNNNGQYNQMAMNNNGQPHQKHVINDKILTYYIGYILFSNDQQTQGFNKLFTLKTIFPWLQKYSYNLLGQPIADWFPEARQPKIGGVEICEPKPVDEGVKKMS